MTDEFTANSRDIQPARRVLVIGLDGATWTILKPLVEANELPVLNKLMSAGAYGAMRTVLPPTSAPSWTSAFTGQNPGKHGVYEFFVRRSVENGFTYVDSRSRATKALWEILGERGKSVGVVNILTTHPAEKVKGFMMSGSFAPYPKTDFFYPPSLGERLRQKFGKFKLREPFHPKYWGHRISNYVTLWREILAIRTEINLFLMEEYPWDFLMTVISCTDHIQHAAWKYIDETHPEHIPGHRDAFIAFYRDVDAAVGKLVEKADDGETSIIIMSDHGFGPRYKHFFLSQWLEDMGWLKTKDLSTDFLEATFVLILQRMGISNERAKVLSSYITRAIDVISPLPLARLLDRILRTVGPKVGLQYYPTCDWSQTKVYCSPCCFGQLFVNLKGREPSGIVSSDEYDSILDVLEEGLFDVKDPESGVQVIERISRGREIYKGPLVHLAPDLLLQSAGDMAYYYVNTGSSPDGTQVTLPAVGTRTANYSGHHSRMGLFLLYGKHIRSRGEMSEVSIVDIAPTVLYLLGEPIPTQMDGQVLTEALCDDFVSKFPVQYDQMFVDVRSEGGSANVYDDEEIKEIEERLRSMGYIS